RALGHEAATAPPSARSHREETTLFLIRRNQTLVRIRGKGDPAGPLRASRHRLFIDRRISPLPACPKWKQCVCCAVEASSRAHSALRREPSGTEALLETLVCRSGSPNG